MFTNRRIRKHGLPAEATVMSMKGRSYGGSEMSRKYDYVLEVRPPDHAGFEARLSLVAAYLGAKPEEYDVLRVKYDPKTLKVLFDFTGDARYDTEAMNARTAQMRKETAEMLAKRKAYFSESPILPGGDTADAEAPDFRDHGVLKALSGVISTSPLVLRIDGAADQVEDGQNENPEQILTSNVLAGIASLFGNGLISRTQFEELQRGVLAKVIDG